MKFPLSTFTALSGHSIETSGDYHYDNRTNNRFAHLGYGIWQYTLSGRGRIDFNTHSKDLFPGTLMLISTPGPHVYYLPADSDSWEFVFLVIKGREAIRLTRIIELNVGNVLDANKFPQTFSLLYEVLHNFLTGGINELYINSYYTYQLYMTLLGEAHGFGINAENDRRFNEVIQFLKDNLHRDIPVEEMARIMKLSRTHFTRLFAKEMNMTPRKYLEDIRLKTATELLFDGQTSIKEAAALCGFGDESYFCRLFKKRYGLSPGKYKGNELSYMMFNR